MTTPPDPQAVAEALLAQCAATPFPHRGRPALCLALPETLGESVTCTLLVTDADGSLSGRCFVNYGAPTEARLRKHAADPVRAPNHLLGPFVEGFWGGPPPGRHLARAAAAHLHAVDPDATKEAREAFGERVAAIAQGRLASLVEAGLDAAGFEPEHRAALRALRRFRAPSRPLVALLLGPPDACRGPAAAACEAHPLLAEIGTRKHTTAGQVREWLGGGPDSLAESCRRLAPALTPGRIARLGAVGLGDLPKLPLEDASAFTGFLRLVADAPRDWVRPDPAGLAAMLGLGAGYEALARMRGADPEALLRPARGDWPGFLARCRKACDPTHGPIPGSQDEVSTAAQSATDPVLHLATKVVLPLLARSEGVAEGMPRDWLTRSLTAARALILADKGMPAILEASALWHARAERIEARMPSGARTRWEAPCPPFVASNGVEVRPLTSAMDLVEEGATGIDAEGVPGLAHCVATYRTLAETGRSHILSVRAPGGDRRLSTVEIKVDGFGRGHVAQHKGLRNAPAPAEAIRAVGEFVTSVRLPVPAERTDAPAFDELGRECGYDGRDDGLVRLAALAYAEFLPRGLRDADLDRLSAHLGFGPAPDPDPDADAPAAPSP